jgi:PAS domain S-box-containing protein
MMASFNFFIPNDSVHFLNGFRAFAETFTDPIMLISEQGTICYSNKPLQCMLGYTEDELDQKPIGELLLYVSVDSCSVFEIKNLEPYNERYTLIMPADIAHKNGFLLPAEVTICPLHTNNATLYVIVCRFPSRSNVKESIDVSVSGKGVSNMPQSGMPASQSHRIIGNSTSIACVRELIDLIGKTESSVLITGESGTGKELVAESLHAASRRADRPLVKLNCSALPETLLESELFGHVKGAFTGAIKDSLGRFKTADGGTLFLDEIGDVAPAVQSKLLRVLESQEFNRIGESLPLKVDVRIIAATNQNLFGLMQQRLFREDLYYRLNVIEIKVPALRERIEDIPLLVKHFLAILNRKLNKTIEVVSAEVMRFFASHSWPGNVRELAHAIEHACVVCQDEVICLHHLPPELQKRRVLADLLPEQTEVMEAERLHEVLIRTGGNKARAARVLRIDRKTLYRRIKKYNTFQLNK